MARVAASGRTPIPPGIKALTGRGEALDGTPRDSAGKRINMGPAFEKKAPAKPDFLSDAASKLWDGLTPDLVAVDVLKPADLMGLAALCETWARWRESVRTRQERGMTQTNDKGVESRGHWVITEETASRELRSWCAEFGLTPAALNKVGGGNGDTDPDNPFD